MGNCQRTGADSADRHFRAFFCHIDIKGHVFAAVSHFHCLAAGCVCLDVRQLHIFIRHRNFSSGFVAVCHQQHAALCGKFFPNPVIHLRRFLRNSNLANFFLSQHALPHQA
jgi:hypothetical protein